MVHLMYHLDACHWLQSSQSLALFCCKNLHFHFDNQLHGWYLKNPVLYCQVQYKYLQYSYFGMAKKKFIQMEVHMYRTPKWTMIPGLPPITKYMFIWINTNVCFVIQCNTFYPSDTCLPCVSPKKYFQFLINPKSYGFTHFWKDRNRCKTTTW